MDFCTLKTGACDGYHGHHTCEVAVSDGNRDDPSYAYCGYPAGHGGDHGHFFL